MTIRRVANQGFTLIEFLIASLISSLAITTIISIVVSAQQVAQQKGQQLYLVQALTSTFQTIEEDIQRAGYDPTQGSSLTLLGAVGVIEQNGTSEFGVAYYRPMSDGKNYRNLRYYLNGHKLMVCEQGGTTQSSIKNLAMIANCRSLLDENIIHVTSFALSSTPIFNANTTSAIWHLSISAHTADNAFSRNLAIDIKQRNWQ